MGKISSDARINPKIRMADIGIRELESIKIYPLSLAGQGEMADIITEALQRFNAVAGPSPVPAPKPGKKSSVQSVPSMQPTPQMSDLGVVAFIIDLIKKNLSKVLTLATDFDTPEKSDEALKKIDNDQAVEIADIVWQQNYENSLKNGIALFKKIMSAYHGSMHPEDELEGAAAETGEAEIQ